MNERWHPAAPTAQDLDVLGFRMYVGPGRLGFIGTLHALATRQDRRDAALMLRAQSWTYDFPVAGPTWLAVEPAGESIAVRG